jgi:hypothetical protein
VLNELGYTVQHSAEDLLRMWWIRTGLINSFSFHATGDYSAEVTESAYCRVISLYSPSVKALIYTRENVSLMTTLRSDSQKVLIVTMPKTPGASDLPGTSVEKSGVIAVIGGSVYIIILDQPNVASVMEQI